MYTPIHTHTHIQTHTHMYIHTVGGRPQALSKILMSGGPIASVVSQGVFSLYYAAQAARGHWMRMSVGVGMCVVYRGPMGQGPFELGIVLSRGPKWWMGIGRV